MQLAHLYTAHVARYHGKEFAPFWDCFYWHLLRRRAQSKAASFTASYTQSHSLLMKTQSSLILTVLCSATMFSQSRSFAVRSVGLLSGSFLSSVRSKAPFSTSLKMTTTDTLLLDNPMLKRDHLPLFNEIEPIHVKSAILNDLDALKKDFLG